MKRRITEVLVDREWTEIPFQDLRKGDIFRMFEDDLAPVAFDKEGKEYIAVCLENPTQDDDGMWGVEAGKP